MHNFLFGLFGVCTYIWPFLLGYVAIMTALDKPIGKTGTKVWQSAVLIVLICAAVDIVRASGIDASFGEYIVSAYNTGVGNVGGGIFRRACRLADLSSVRPHRRYYNNNTSDIYFLHAGYRHDAHNVFQIYHAPRYKHG